MGITTVIDGRYGQDWSRDEVEATVTDYFAMLEKELRREPYRKSDHWKALLPWLDGRTKRAAEMKHQNISAVLIEARQPYIEGYKPYFNYQRLLRDVVLERLPQTTSLLDAMEQAASFAPVAMPSMPPLKQVLTPPPPRLERRRSITASMFEGMPAVEYAARTVKAPVGVDYIRREMSNRLLGQMGEEFVLGYERERLRAAGQGDLAKKVEWSSKVRGDGLGYDVLSFQENGTSAYIEVKTTDQGSYHPFFLTRGEVEASERLGAAWRLYRVYAFSREPRLFVLEGAISGHELRLEPRVYEVYPAGGA